MQYCVVDVADLLREFERLDAEPWSQETFAAKRKIQLALFASGDRDAVQRMLQSEIWMFEGTIRGVLFDEGDPLSEPFDDNPWGIRKTESLVGAIDHVWNLFDAPALTQSLLERVIGLVLLDTAQGPRLGYVHFHERSSYDIPEAFSDKRRPPFDRRHAVDWEPFGDISLFVGDAPNEAATTKSGLALPAPLRALYRVHGGLHDTLWHLYGPEQMSPWSSMLDHKEPTIVRAEEDDEGIRSDQLLHFFSYGDDRSDLFDVRDPDEWVVRSWGDGRLYAGAGEPFLEWLEAKAPFMLSVAED